MLISFNRIPFTTFNLRVAHVRSCTSLSDRMHELDNLWVYFALVLNIVCERDFSHSFYKFELGICPLRPSEL